MCELVGLCGRGDLRRHRDEADDRLSGRHWCAHDAGGLLSRGVKLQAWIQRALGAQA